MKIFKRGFGNLRMNFAVSSLLILMFIPAISLAEGTLQVLSPNRVNNYDGSALLNVGPLGPTVLQFIDANTPPNNTGPLHLSSGSQISSGVIGGGIPVPTGTAGTFNYYLSYIGNVYVRAWNTNNIAGSVRGSFYNTMGPYNLPGPPSPPSTPPIPTFSTMYKADVPLAPTCLPSVGYVTVGVEMKFFIDASVRSFTPVGPVSPTNYQAEVAPYGGVEGPITWPTAKYNFEVDKGGSIRRYYSDTLPLKLGQGGTATALDGTLASDPAYYTMGSDFQIRVRENNYFGFGAWSVWAPAPTFRMPSQGITFNLGIEHIDDTPPQKVKLNWEASAGLGTADFAIYYSGNPEAGYGPLPAPTITSPAPSRFVTASFDIVPAAREFFRVAPRTSVIDSYPREVAGIVIFNLRKGINNIAFPFRKISNLTSQVRNIKELVENVNATTGVADLVTAVGWYDSTAKRSAGFRLDYSTATPTFVSVGLPPATLPESIEIEMDRGYQITLKQDVGGMAFVGVR